MLYLSLISSSFLLLFLLFPSTVVSTTTTTTFSSSFACSSNLDCNLNGVCQSTNNSCTCRAGWTGIDCGQLDLLPTLKTNGFYREFNASWGGSIIEENGKYYMFLAYMLGSCGLNAWQGNSGIMRAVSSTDSPLGPYVNETLVRSWFSHNPTVSRHPDGTLLVWHIGNGLQQGGYDYQCTNGTTPPPPPPPPVKFINPNGQCLTTSGPYPCYEQSQGWELCPLIASTSNCNNASYSPLWSYEDSSAKLLSNFSTGAAVNIDCNSCDTGTVAKLFSDGASGLKYNKTSKQFIVTGCGTNPNSMCLSTGLVGGANKPCGGGGEPYLDTQIHLVPCNSSDSIGWTMVSPSSDEEGTEEYTIHSSSAVSSTFPYPSTDVNVLVSSNGSVWGEFIDSGILQGNRNPFPYETDNPSPLVFPNGTTWVMFRSWNPPGNTTTPIGIARSDSATWNTTYTLPTAPVPQGYTNSTAPIYVPLEDPFMWFDTESGTYHALFHNMGGCGEVGCHAFSEDGFSWFMARTCPYTSLVQFQDGSSITYARRERPHLVFNKLGQPAFLSNGVQETWENDHSYTLVQSINVPFP